VTPFRQTTFREEDRSLSKSRLIPYAAASAIVISRRGAISLHSLDLREEYWRRRVVGWPRLGVNERSVVWFDEGHLLQVDLFTSEVMVRVPLPYDGNLAGGCEHRVVLSTDSASLFRAIDLTSGELWNAPDGIGAIATSPSAVYVSLFGGGVAAHDWVTGRVLWNRPHTSGSFTELHRLMSGYPSFWAADERLFIVLQGGIVLVCDAHTGMSSRPADHLCLASSGGRRIRYILSRAAAGRLSIA
jgi:hypothetical protein